MVDIKKIKELTPKEVEVVCAVQELIRPAEEMAELVREAYRFRFGESKICVWNDGSNEEWLTYEGKWQARYLHQEYDIACTKESIFNYLVAEYIVENNLHEDAFNIVKVDLEDQAKAFGYFREFIERTKKEHPELCRADEDT